MSGFDAQWGRGSLVPPSANRLGQTCLADTIVSLYGESFIDSPQGSSLPSACIHRIQPHVSVSATEPRTAHDEVASGSLKRRHGCLLRDVSNRTGDAMVTGSCTLVALDLEAEWLQRPWPSDSSEAEGAPFIVRRLALEALNIIAAAGAPVERLNGISWTLIGLNCTAYIEALLTQLVKLLRAKRNGCDLGSLSSSSTEPVVILKDILRDEILLLALPRTFIDMLCFLFLPRGLNFRNVLWHGFMAPAEVPPSCVALCVAIEGALISVVAEMTGCEPRNLRLPLCAQMSYPDDYWNLFSEISTLSIFDGISRDALGEMIAHSLLVVAGRESLVASAYADLASQDYVSCLLKIIPCIEHGLRLIFCIVNGDHDFILASEEKYFSTLDGFGQRSRHQLLLDLHVHTYLDKCITETNKPNKLPRILGKGLYSLLIDLFFTSSGPGVRSVFAHGEFHPAISGALLASPSSSLSKVQASNDRFCIAHMARVTMLLFTALMRHFDVRWSRGAAPTVLHSAGFLNDANPHQAVLKNLITERLVAFGASPLNYSSCPLIEMAFERVSAWSSCFHTLSILRSRLVEVSTELGSRARDILQRTIKCIDAADSSSVDTRTILVCSSNGVILSISDSTRRISELVGCKTPQPTGDAALGTANYDRKAVASSSVLTDKALACIVICNEHVKYLKDECRHSAATHVLENLSGMISRLEVFVATLGSDGSSIDPAASGSATVGRLSAAVIEALTGFQEDVLSVFVPVAEHYGASVQVLQTISDYLGFESAALNFLEASVLARSASTAERRQYLQHVLCLMPISICFSLMCVGAIVAHFALKYVSSVSEDPVTSGAMSIPLLLSAASALKAALGCSTPTADGAAIEVLKGKKSAEQCCLQLMAMLDRRSLRTRNHR